MFLQTGFFTEKDSYKIPDCHPKENINIEIKNYEDDLGTFKSTFNCYKLPVYIDIEQNLISSLKIPFSRKACINGLDFLMENFESPLANVKLKEKRVNGHRKVRQNSNFYVNFNDTSSSHAEKPYYLTQKTIKNLRTNLETILRHLEKENEFDNNFNKYCVNQNYPGTIIERFHVPYDKQSFKVSYESYIRDVLPVYDNPNQLPYGIHTLQPQDPIEYNHKNPVGRTGLLGRGILRSYGSNKYGFIAVTRIKPTYGGEIYMETTKSRLPAIQFLAVTCPYYKNLYMIPNGTVNDYYLEGFPRMLTNKKLNNQEKCKFMVELYQELFKNSKLIYKGYLDDYKNTDNAWVDAYAEYSHITGTEKDVSNLLEIALKDDDMNPENVQFKWVNFTSKHIYPPHKILLRNILNDLINEIQ